MSGEKALYDSFIADYYDNSPMVTLRTQDILFYRNAARKYGDPVLELGCGTGRVTLAIAEAGYRIVGLDISKKMLERAMAKRHALRRETRERVHLVREI
jgi:ubiquinone/menaquinone biosynthesis C-methylase UbiE